MCLDEKNRLIFIWIAAICCLLLRSMPPGAPDLLQWCEDRGWLRLWLCHDGELLAPPSRVEEGARRDAGRLPRSAPPLVNGIRGRRRADALGSQRAPAAGDYRTRQGHALPYPLCSPSLSHLGVVILLVSVNLSVWCLHLEMDCICRSEERRVGKECLL